MTFLIIDGNSIINRAFYGIKSLYNSFGQPTNAIYGFLNILIKLISQIKPEYAAVAFDVKAPTFRSKKYNQYKATRHPTPDELLKQFEPIQKILNAMGIVTIEKPGFEADDILGTLANITKTNKDLKCFIVTGDKDSLQLVNKNVTVKIMSTKIGTPISTDYDVKTVVEKYGISPSEFIDFKALMGDKSDNVPGLSGIGEKTALALISKYHNIEYIYENIDNIDEKINLKRRLLENKEIAFLSKDLVTICNCVPIDTNIESYKIQTQNDDELFKILSDLEIFSIIKRLKLDNFKKSSTNDIPFQITFKYLMNESSPTTQNSNLKINNILDEIASSLSSILDNNIYILNNTNEQFILKIDGKIFVFKDYNQIYKLLLDAYGKNPNIRIYTHQSKNFHIKMLTQYGKTIPVKFDSEIAAYLLNSSMADYDLEKLTNIYCHCVVSDNPQAQINIFVELCKIMEKKINENNLSNLFYDIEIPLCVVLADMELTGFKIDQRGLILFGEQLDDDIEKLQNEIFKLANCEFNLNSSLQLAKVLFEDLQLPYGKKNKRGFSTNAEVLESLKEQHPIINKILKYRLLKKLKNTYVDGLLKEVKLDNRIHSIFNNTETKTGRISSEKPNLQNIPIRTPLGSKLRKYFIAQEGCKLVDGDYSQIELRILAHISNDENMINAFNQNQDIHKKTASEIFNIDINDVTEEMRTFAKTINFGIIYGMSSFSLAKDIGVSVSKAQRYIDSYFQKFSNVKKYLDDTIRSAIEAGFVFTIFGRKRYVSELSLNNNKITRAFGERIARNTPIQGASADIIKIAMVNVYNRLKSEKLKSKLILQIHDELIIESPDNEVEIVKNILKEEMQQATKLNVALKVDIDIGESWLEAH